MQTARRFPQDAGRRIAPLGATALLVAVAACATPVPSEMTFPGQSWEVVEDRALRGYGWSSGGLDRTADFLRTSSNSTGVVVIDRGREVFSYGNVQELSYVASVRKSILAMLYGEFVEDGTIDLQATLAELSVDDEGGLLEIERQARLEHLITALSGVYHAASNGGDNLADAPPRGSQEPGSYMLYNNWDFNAAGAIFEQLTGRDIYDEVERQLAIPMGFEDWDRDAQRKSGDLEVSRNPAYHMWLSTRDMARIGHLMLNRGNWNGTRLIPADWVDRIVSVVTPLEEMNPLPRREGYFGYGYMWWVWDGPAATGAFEGAYTGRGAIGQWITVLPAVDLVIAHKTNSDTGLTTSWDSWHRMLELLLEARGLGQDSYPWSPGR